MFLSRLSIIIIIIGVNITFIPLYLLGLLGMPRRIYIYNSIYLEYNYISTIGSFITSIGMFIILINFIIQILSNNSTILYIKSSTEYMLYSNYGYITTLSLYYNGYVVNNNRIVFYLNKLDMLVYNMNKLYKYGLEYNSYPVLVNINDTFKVLNLVN